MMPSVRGWSEPAVWLPLSGLAALGAMGGRWEMYDATHLGSVENDLPVRETAKSILVREPMQIVLGLAADDPGQLLLWKAFRSEDAWPFRLDFPGGGVSRRWRALVVAMGEVFDEANSVMRLSVELQQAGPVVRSEEA